MIRRRSRVRRVGGATCRGGQGCSDPISCASFYQVQVARLVFHSNCFVVLSMQICLLSVPFCIETKDAGAAIGQRGGTVKEMRAMETCKKQKNCYQYACFCSATMLA